MVGGKVISVGVIIWKWKNWPSAWSPEVHARSCFVRWRHFFSTREVPGHKCRCRDKSYRKKRKQINNDNEFLWKSMSRLAGEWFPEGFAVHSQNIVSWLCLKTLLSSVSLQNTFPFFQGKGQLNLETKGRSKTFFTVVTIKKRQTCILDGGQQFLWNCFFVCLCVSCNWNTDWNSLNWTTYINKGEIKKKLIKWCTTFILNRTPVISPKSKQVCNQQCLAGVEQNKPGEFSP